MEALGDIEREAGIRRVVSEAALANLTSTVTSGAILSAFALYMGASNATIGLLAAAPFLAQLLQAPTVVLLERLRRRRPVAVGASVIGRAALALLALCAFVPETSIGLVGLVFVQIVFCAAGSIGGCAWNAWLRDLVPDRRLGDVVARRTALGTTVSMLAGIAAAVALDQAPENSVWLSVIYAALYLIASIAGLASAWVVSRIPEPPMPAASGLSLTRILRTPFREKNFRRVMMFLGSWQFAVNLATPFFTVFMIDQLRLPLVWVMGFTIVSQLTNILALRSWGRLSDRFSNKSVLAATAPAFLLCILGFAVASQIAQGPLLVGYLIALHALMGVCTAGVTLASANIVLKLSPRGESAAYLAASALVTALAAGAAALIGGVFADFFSMRSLEIALRWTNPVDDLTLTPIRLNGWDFYFVIASAIGLFALHRLSLVTETGEIDNRAMIDQIFLQARRSVRSMSSAGGLLVDLPANLFREVTARTRLKRMQDRNVATPPEPSSRSSA